MSVRRTVFAAVCCAGLAWTMAHAEPLTLEVALAAARTHPERDIAAAEVEIARAERDQIDAELDWQLSLDGALRGGLQAQGDWAPDHVARLVVRKPLFDFGRSFAALGAAGEEIAARSALLDDAEAATRLTVIARFFDVLLADLNYSADNEAMAVAYVNFDQAQDRFELGQLTQPQLSEIESRYQQLRSARDASAKAQRGSRQALANAMNQTRLPGELVAPVLMPSSAAVLPDFETLAARVEAANPVLSALRAQVTASLARRSALRAANRPRIDAEVSGGAYSRDSITRDDVSAGLVFSVPLWQGARVDSQLAREHAVTQRAQARLESMRLRLRQALLDTYQQIEWLRDTALPAAQREVAARDWTLERARAEYELELKTNLGTAMADTQYALLKQKTAEYRLALACEQLAALAGGALPTPLEAAP